MNKDVNQEKNAEPIRVLHVLGALNIGGAETMLINQYRSLDRNIIQYDFVIHTSNKCDYTDEILSLGGKIYSVPTFKGTNIYTYIKSWVFFLKKHKEYKIIHGHMRSTASIYLGLANIFNRKTIAHSHSTSNGVGVVSKIKDIMQYTVRFQADYFFACSLDAGKWMFGKKIIHKNNFKIMNNGIDIKKFSYNINIRKDIRKKMKLEDKFVVGHVGRFTYPKNHEFLIDIFEKIYAVKKNAILLLVGEGELELELIEKIKRYKLEKRVMILGNRKDVYTLLQVMDCFVFPSKFEGLGISVIEAQAASLPCFISENLPKEVVVTNLVQSISLKLDANKWAEIILSKSKKNIRKNTEKELTKEGYNIEKTVEFISNFYLKLF